MKVGFIQFDCLFGEKEHNLNRVEYFFKNNFSDLWVLPELFNTGYLFSSTKELEALAEPIEIIANTVRLTLEKTPPELVADILEKGLIMTGGGSLLIGLSELLQEEMGISTFISSEPEYCVIKGIGKVLENFNYYQRVIIRTSKGI